FEEIYKRYYSKLYSLARKFGSSTLEADDFVQQSFLKLWEERQQLREDVLLDQQLFVICKHLILNFLKREQKMVSNQDFTLDQAIQSEPEEESFSGKWEQLNAGIQKMPGKRKEIFLLHKIENLTYKEISKFLNVSTKTIANHIYLANDF